jgi:hypothetical protein
MMEGPKVGTEASHDIIRQAMVNYRTISHLGERYTTMRCSPGVISQTYEELLAEVGRSKPTITFSLSIYHRVDESD